MMRRAIAHISLIFIALLFAMQLVAQSPAFTNYLLDNGLSSSTVYGTLQDRNGFMWFATESGVSRFDGNAFQNFSVSDGLSGNDVLGLFEDSRGRIWFFPFNETVSFFQNGTIHNSKTDPWLAEVRGRNFISCHTEDANGTLWFGDDGRKIFQIFPDNCVEIDTMMIGENRRTFRAMFTTKNGEVMAASDTEVYNLSRRCLANVWYGSFEPYVAPRATMIGIDSLLCFFGHTLGLFIGESVRPLTLQGLSITEEVLYMANDSVGGLWVGSRNGAVHITAYEIEDSVLKVSAFKRYLTDKSITMIVEDNEGNCWMTTAGEGVFFFPSLSAVSYDGGKAIMSSFANEVYRDRKGRVWVGFDRVTYGELKDSVLYTTQLPFGQDGRGRTNEIFEDQEGNIFLMMDASSVVIPVTGEVMSSTAGAKAATQTMSGTYYMSHSWEVDSVSYVPIQEFYGLYKKERSDRRVLLRKRTSSMLATRDGRLLMGTLEGMAQWDGQKVSVVPEVPTFSISDILETKEGVIWVSTLAQGIGYLYGGEYHDITRKDGLASDICHGLAIDEKGVIFAATDMGISRVEVLDYARDAFKVRNFGKNFGLASNEVRSVAVGDGIIYAATARGLTVLDEDFLTAIPAVVRVHILGVAVAGKPIAFGTSPIVLDHRQNHLSIAFTGISFRNADKLQFQYRLSRSGEDAEWTPILSRQLEFPSLGSGIYELRIRASVDGLQLTEGETRIQFEILPAVWETIWFRVVAILIGIVLIAVVFYLAFRRLRSQERKRMEILKRIAVSEQKALRSQMNPHFIFNSLNSIEKFFITNRPQEANAFIADFSDLIRSILDLSAKAAITLREELRFVELFLTLESHRMDHRFTYSVEIDPSLSPDILMVPPMIVQPFAENAVWHGISPLDRRDGHIRLRVIGTNNGFLIVIEDNGIGRQRSEELKSKYRPKHKSSGVRITTERLELLNLDLTGPDFFAIDFEDLPLQADGTAGTRVVIFIPETYSTTAI